MSQEQREGAGPHVVPCPATSQWGLRPPVFSPPPTTLPRPRENSFWLLFPGWALGSFKAETTKHTEGSGERTCVLQSGHGLCSRQKTIPGISCMPGPAVGTGPTGQTGRVPRAHGRRDEPHRVSALNEQVVLSSRNPEKAEAPELWPRPPRLKPPPRYHGNEFRGLGIWTGLGTRGLSPPHQGQSSKPQKLG